MMLSRTIAFVIIAGTGIVGAFIGRAVPRDIQNVRANASVSPVPSVTTHAEDECEAVRTAITSTKTQLAICKAFDTVAPEPEPFGIRERSEPEPTALKSQVEKTIEEEIRLYNERLESLPEAVVVRHSSGIIRVYSPDEWPGDGDGVIIKRKFKDGRIERYPVWKRPSAPAASTP